MKVIISNLAWIKRIDIDEVTLHLVRNELTIIPKAMGAFSRTEPIRLYAMNSDWLGVPRPYYFSHKHLFKNSFEEYRIAKGEEIPDLKTDIVLRPEDQEPMAKFVEEYFKSRMFAGGAVEAYTAFGKSFLTLDIIRRMRLNTLIILHRESLLDQWMDSAKRFFNNKVSIGRVQGTDIDYRGRHITFSMLQTLMTENNDKFPKDFFGYFGMIVVDECLDGDTWIATPNGQKRLKDIKIGDSILDPSGNTIKVIKKKRTNKQAFRYNFSSGRYLIASEDHPIAVMRCSGWNNDLRDYVFYRDIDKIDNVENGEMFINRNLKRKKMFLEEYFIGWYLGDGYSNKYMVRFSFRKQEKAEVIEWVLSELNIAYKKSILKRGDITIVAKKDALLLLEKYKVEKNTKRGMKTIPSSLVSDCSLGIIGGLIDSDGHVTKCGQIEFDTVSKSMADDMFSIFCSLGFQCSRRLNKRRNSNHSEQHRILIWKSSLDIFLSKIGFKVKSKFDLANGMKQQKFASCADEFKSKISLGNCDLYDIEVDSKDKLFVANGLIVHNCHILGAEKFGSVLPKFSNKYTILVSGTMRRADGCENVFKFCGGEVIYKASEKNRIRPVIYVRNTKYIPKDKRGRVKQIESKISGLKSITESKSRNEFIAVDVIKAVKAGRYPLVMSERLEQLRNIREQVQKIALANGLNLSHGFYVGDRSEEELKRAATCDIVYATIQMAKEGVDIPRLCCLFLASPLSEIEQISGRICRRHPDKKQPFFIDYVDLEITPFRSSFVNRYKLYNKLKFEVKGIDSREFNFLKYVR